MSRSVTIYFSICVTNKVLANNVLSMLQPHLKKSKTIPVSVDMRLETLPVELVLPSEGKKNLHLAQLFIKFDLIHYSLLKIDVKCCIVSSHIILNIRI